MISLWISQGENVTSGAVGPMMLGSFSVPVVRRCDSHCNHVRRTHFSHAQYAVAMSQLAPALGPFLGALVSYIISIVTCSIPIAFILKKLEARYTQLNPDEEKKDGAAVTGADTELAIAVTPVKSDTDLNTNGVEHVTDADETVTPLEDEIGAHKEE